MNEFKEALSILKTRWLEAALIIGLMFVPELSNQILLRYYHRYSAWWVLFLNLSILLFALLVLTGFLRTVYLEQKKRQSPINLILTGKHFFLRLAGFGLLYAIVQMSLIWSTHWIIKTTITDISLKDISSPIGITGIIVISLILAKPFLLIPALIIVLDCGLSESFRFTWRTKLLNAKPLLTVFLVQVVVLPYLSLFFPNFPDVSPAISCSYVFSILHYIVLRVLTLIVLIMAVRFVGSLGIVYNKPDKPIKSFKLVL
jgi:hypothetical protein